MIHQKFWPYPSKKKNQEKQNKKKKMNDIPFVWSEAPTSMIQEWLKIVTDALKVKTEVPNWADNKVGAYEEDSKLIIKRRRTSISSREKLELFEEGAEVEIGSMEEVTE